MRKKIDIISKILENIASALMWGVVFCILVQIAVRYISKTSVPWTEEIARYLLILVAFFGGALCSRDGEHLGAYFLRDRFKGKTKVIVYLFNSIVSLGFIVFIMPGIVIMAKRNMNQTAYTNDWIKIGWLYIGQLFGFIMMMLYTVRDIIHIISLLLTDGDIKKSGGSSPFEEE